MMKIHPGAETVRFTKSTPDPEKYQYLGDVSCYHESLFSSATDRIKSCRNDLKNQAFQLSGTLVFIENEQLGAGACAICITMVGSAYKKK